MDGVFALQHQRSVDVRFFRVPAATEYLGDIEPEIMKQLVRMWEDG